VVLSLVLVVWVLARRHGRWQVGVRGESRPVPSLPAELLSGRARTWVVFTTPFCASCRPVADLLEASDQSAGVVVVDATREPQLAETFLVRSAPTALLADASGEVQARLVGMDAVSAYVRSPA